MYYYTVKQMAMRHESFTESSFRYLIFDAENNGLWPAIKRIGRKVLIDEHKFLRWIEDPDCLVRDLKSNGSYDFEFALYLKGLSKA